MFKKPISLALLTLGIGCFAAAACSSNNSNNNGGDGGATTSSTTLGSGSNTSTGSGSNTSNGSGTSSGSGKSPLQIDDMSATSGSQLSMGATVRAILPTGVSPGTWYSFTTDPNMASVVPNQGSNFAFTTVAQPSGVLSTHAACLTSPGFIGYAAGEGFNFAVTDGGSSDAGDAAAPATATTFDTSSFTGVTFYAMAFGDAGAAPTIKIAFPDDQTHGADPTSACNMSLHSNSSCGQCDDDFSDQSEPLGATWNLITIKFADIVQGGYGGTCGTFPSWDKAHVFGMNFQVNGMAPDAGLNPAFGFCIADLQFTQ